MALIIYPTTDWDSYVSVLNADTMLTNYLFDSTAWLALTSAKKEILLRQASMLISAHITDPEEVETPEDIVLATAYLADYGRTTNLLVDSQSGNIKRLKIEGAIEKEYFAKGSQSNSFPSIVKTLLVPYGYSNGTKIERS